MQRNGCTTPNHPTLIPFEVTHVGAVPLPQDPLPPAGGAPQAVTVMVAVVVAATQAEEEEVVR
jgi:hypothetical protein